MSASQQLKTGEMLGPYRIVRKIGQGGMGEVYEAWEDNIQRRVAIKILAHDASSHPSWSRRLNSEGRAMARLVHRNIVSLYGMAKHGDRLYLAMEFVDGIPLDKFLQNTACGLPTLSRIFTQVAEGLAAAHEAGVIHRDVKPQNVVVDRALNVKLLDFGISKMNEDEDQVKTATGVFVGSVTFVAPEIILGEKATPRSDVYSLGLLAYFLFTGGLPFSGSSNLECVNQILKSPLTFPPKAEAILPPELLAFIRRMTSKIKAERFAGVREALRAFEALNFDYLPADLRLPGRPPLLIENHEHLRRLFQNARRETVEMRFLFTLALDAQLRTARGNDGIIHIGDAAVFEAQARFDEALKKLKKPITRSYAEFGVAAVALTASLGLLFYFWPRDTKPAATPPLAGLEAAPKAAPRPAPSAPALSVPPPVAVAVPVPAPAPAPVKIEAKPEPAKDVVSIPPPSTAAKPAPLKKTALAAPTGLTPADRAVIVAGSDAGIEYRWKPKNQSPPLKFQLEIRSVNSDFSKKFSGEGTSLKSPELPPGFYLWTVRTVDADGRRSPASEARTFEVKAPAVPAAEPAVETKAPAKPAARSRPVLLPPQILKPKNGN